MERRKKRREVDGEKEKKKKAQPSLKGQLTLGHSSSQEVEWTLKKQEMGR